MAIVVFLLACFLFGQAQGVLKVANSFGDHMVLQRGPQRAIIWGTSSANGQTVTATITGQGSPTTATVQQGMWKLKLPAITQPGPFTIDITASDGHVTLRDVLFGDVWVCSGQSNMEFEMSKIINSAAEIQKASQFNTIRYMETQNTQSNNRANDVTIGMPWTAPNAGSLGQFSAVCFLFAEYIQPTLNYPIGLIGSYWGGTSIEAWSPHEAMQQCPVVQHGSNPCCPTAAEVLWNTKIYPLLPMTIKGALWFQGETNTDHPTEYACQIKAMVSQWRSQFSQASLRETRADFPFGYVQLAGYHESDLNNVGGFPPLRWSQTANHGVSPNSDLPNTFMAVAMDLPDFTSPYDPIHSRYKQEVARRLSLGARNLVYGHHDVAFQGPFPSKFTLQGSKLTIEYDSGRAHLQIKHNNGFDICCSEGQPACNVYGQMADAPVVSHTDSSVTIDTSRCGSHQLRGVRYAWRTSPCRSQDCPIYDSVTGLPAATFYIDDITRANEIIG